MTVPPPRPSPRRTAGRQRVATVAMAALAALLVTGPTAVATTGPTTTTTSTVAPLAVDDPAVTSGLAWHLDAIGARVAWRASIGAAVRVAVVDSGVDSTHPDLLGQVEDAAVCIGAAGSADGCEPGGTDTDGHGTHVAGLIAARADDGVGVAGVAPRARILAVKALEARCTDDGCATTGDPADLAAGIRWALDRHADVINLSITSQSRTAPVLLDAIGEAWDEGAVVVLSAGRVADQPVFFDTGAALVVTATDRDGNRAPYAPDVDAARVAVAAPGGRTGDTDATCHEGGTPAGILSTFALGSGDGSGYACLAGTSMAAAQVSGGLALLLSMGFTRDEAVDRLVSTVRPVAGQGLGQGILDLAAATARPYPPGVNNRHDSFATGIVPLPATELPSVGPFSVPSEPGDDGPPAWVFMVVGAVALGVAAELAMRLLARRRTAEASPDHEAGAPPDGPGGGGPPPAGPPLAPPP